MRVYYLDGGYIGHGLVGLLDDDAFKYKPIPGPAQIPQEGLPCLESLPYKPHFFDCIKSISGAVIHRPDKARANAYLSSTPEPHVSVGVAAKKDYWALDHEAFDSIRNFMQGLCAA